MVPMGGHDHAGHSHDHAAHSHGHAGHSHAGHSHGVSLDADARYLTIALLLIVGFMAVEVVVGILAHSLALLSDAGHMLTDAGALGLSIFVIRYVQGPGGETAAEVGQRADRAIARMRAVAGNVLVFSSAHILRVLAARWLANHQPQAEKMGTF